MNIKNYFIEKQNSLYKSSVKKRVKRIEKLIKEKEKLSNEDLRKLYFEIKNDCTKNNTDLDTVLEDVYSIVAIFAERLLKMKPYSVQLQGAVILFDKNIAEMKTGEGKTLTSVFPAVLAATSGKKVHIVTVNEYLANRDKEILKPIFNALGLTVGFNSTTLKAAQKKVEYNKDILYSTASELGFDYLRDNIVTDVKDRVNPHGHNFAFIDEVDLVLIDEAKTPLIIGKAVPENDTFNIKKANSFVNTLNSEDYKIDKKTQTVTLTVKGEDKLNKFFNTENVFDDKHTNIVHRVNQALLANLIYQKDVEYTLGVYNGKREVLLIDTFTGRITHGRRFMNGLHQALEAKHLSEGITINDENKSAATITLQNYFRLYKHLSGMSGTAEEERTEFQETYGLGVIKVDTNKPVQREDLPIVAFSNKHKKWVYLIDRVLEHHKMGSPILIGTVSVEDSETVSKLLREKKIKHKVLNAKQDKKEAEIIALAGKYGAVTVATNMAGRGTDIKTDKAYKLVVFLTELNQSSRIDNQLKGRTARQGALGQTETIISLEDSIFSKSSLANFADKQLINPLPKSFTRMLKNIQEELESASTASRRQALKFDDVIREQRTLFYQSRDKVLTADLTSDYLINLVSDYCDLEKSDISKLANSRESVNKVLKDVILFSMDTSWREHLDSLDNLKQGITWRGQTGNNILIIYQNEAQILYNELTEHIYSYIKETILTAVKERRVN